MLKLRINKYIALCGVASRRKAEELILEGKVSIDNKIIKDLAIQVQDNNIVKVNNKIIRPVESYKYFILNKPIGYISTAKDQFGRKSVIDFFDSNDRIYPVGRLDYDSRGLLLMTNDGDLTYKLTHPKHNIYKKYEVRVDKPLNENEIKEFMSGVDIGGYITAPCRLKRLSSQALYEVIIGEGKNRQIRKMFGYFGKKVIDLNRVAIGELELSTLKEGSYRALTEKEINYLKKIVEIN